MVVLKYWKIRVEKITEPKRSEAMTKFSNVRKSHTRIPLGRVNGLHIGSWNRRWCGTFLTAGSAFGECERTLREMNIRINRRARVISEKSTRMCITYVMNGCIQRCRTDFLMTGIQRVVVCFVSLIADVLVAYFGYQSFAHGFDESATSIWITTASFGASFFEICLVTDKFFGLVA